MCPWREGEGAGRKAGLKAGAISLSVWKRISFPLNKQCTPSGQDSPLKRLRGPSPVVGIQWGQAAMSQQPPESPLNNLHPLLCHRVWKEWAEEQGLCLELFVQLRTAALFQRRPGFLGWGGGRRLTSVAGEAGWEGER